MEVVESPSLKIFKNSFDKHPLGVVWPYDLTLDLKEWLGKRWRSVPMLNFYGST